MPIYFTRQSPFHCAIIMDGNGRWAIARGLPRAAGHRAGASALRRAVEAAPGSGIGILTLFAFSSDNWRRPGPEVSALMGLLGDYLDAETARCVENGVRLNVIGRRDRIPGALGKRIASAEAATRQGSRLWLRIAIDYSSRDAIASAAGCGGVSRDALAGSLGPEVDLLIRTGGEQRLSDFLLWESAYAELVFMRRLWPDFDGADLEAAMRDFRSRSRRFGGIPAPLVAERRSGPERWLD
jgi:undecaprenyl diphosphate synthase